MIKSRLNFKILACFNLSLMFYRYNSLDFAFGVD